MTAPQDKWARPLATTLVNAFRVQSCNFRRVVSTYDPSVGVPVRTVTDYPGAGAVTSMSNREEGGASGIQDVNVWIDMKGIGDIWPTTEDEISYRGIIYKIVEIDPKFAGDVDYACKVRGRAY